MSPILLTTDDFNVFYSIAQTAEKTALLQEYIDRYEESFIKKILGAELGQHFIDDIRGEDSDSGDIEERFQVLLDPFIKQPRQEIHESKGMKSILSGLIFYHYIADTQIKHTQSGVVLSDVETAKAVSPENAARLGEQKWNDSVVSIRAIQWWCGHEDRKNYCEFKGTYFKPLYSPFI